MLLTSVIGSIRAASASCAPCSPVAFRGTALMISTQAESQPALSDRILVLNHGRLVASGTVEGPRARSKAASDHRVVTTLGALFTPTSARSSTLREIRRAPTRALHGSYSPSSSLR